jgi:PAS domain S-box-containing protein
LDNLKSHARWRISAINIGMALSAGSLLAVIALALFLMRGDSEKLDVPALGGEIYNLHLASDDALTAADDFLLQGATPTLLQSNSQALIQQLETVLAFPGALDVLPDGGAPLILFKAEFARLLEPAMTAKQAMSAGALDRSLVALAEFLESDSAAVYDYLKAAFRQLGQIEADNRARANTQIYWFDIFAIFVVILAVLALATLWLRKRETEAVERSLRQAVRDLAEVQRIAHLGTVRWDYRADRVTWSDEFARIYGLEPGGLMCGADFQALVIPTDVERVVATEADALKRSQASGKPAMREVTYRAYRSDGQVIDLAAISELMADDKGRPLAMVSTVRDVTAEVQAKRALLDSERSLVAAQRIANVGSFRRNMKTGHTHWSNEMYRMLGLDPDEGAVPLRQIFHAEDMDGVIRMLNDLRRPDAPDSERQVTIDGRMLHSNGSVLNIRGTVEMSYDGIGQPDHLTGTLRDVTPETLHETALREAVAEAERANTAKSEFLAVMSHELRTPMNGVLGMLGAMAEASLPPEQTEQLQIARSSADSLLVILNDILDMSKIEAGKVELEIASFELAPVVRSVIHLYAQRAREKGIILDSRIGDDVPLWLTGDSGRIRQILANLVSNAVKFTSTGSVIVSVQMQGMAANGDVSLRFAVADTGLGIPLEAQSQVFGRFNQLDASYTRRFGGTGLGLSICRSLAELMAGTMSFESVPDKGTTFFLDISLPAAEAKVKQHVVVTNAVLQRMRILVAEDNNINQIVARSMLERLGQQADFALNGQEAIEAAEKFSYDIIFMDVSMPVLDGLEATRHIRKMAGSRGRVPILGLTAHAGDAERQSCLDAGFDEVLSKPLLLAALRDALARWQVRPDAKDDPSTADGPSADAESSGIEVAQTAGAGGDQGRASSQRAVMLSAADAQFIDDVALKNGLKELASAVGESALPNILQAALSSLERHKTVIDGFKHGATQDRDELERSFHSLVGLSKTLGSEGVSRLAYALELEAASLPPTHAEIEILQVQIDLFARAVKQHLSLQVKA